MQETQNFDGELTDSGFFEDPEWDGRVILKYMFEVAMEIIISWNVTPYNLVVRYCLLIDDAVLFVGQLQYEDLLFLG